MKKILFSFDEKVRKNSDGVKEPILSSIDFVIYDTDNKNVKKYYYVKDKNDVFLENLKEVNSVIRDAVSKSEEIEIISFAYSQRWEKILQNVLRLDEDVLSKVSFCNLMCVMNFLDVNPVAHKYESLWLKEKRMFHDEDVNEETPTIMVCERIVANLSKMKLWMGQNKLLLG